MINNKALLTLFWPKISKFKNSKFKNEFDVVVSNIAPNRGMIAAILKNSRKDH